MRRWIARLMVGPAVVGVALVGATPFLSVPTASAAPTSPTSTTSTTNYPPSAASLGSSSSVTTPGGTITLSAAGLKYPEACVVTIDGEVIGHASTSPDGKFQVTVTIPSNIPPGEHTIIATCDRGDVVTTTIDIEAASGASPPGASPPGGTTTSLAFTGTDTIATAGAGAGIIAVGGLLVLGTRRRRRSSWDHRR